MKGDLAVANIEQLKGKRAMGNWVIHILDETFRTRCGEDEEKDPDM